MRKGAQPLKRSEEVADLRLSGIPSGWNTDDEAVGFILAPTTMGVRQVCSEGGPGVL